MAFESVTVEQWLDAKLRGDSQLNTLVGGRIYAYQAPQDAAFPFVVFNFQSGLPVASTGQKHFVNNMVFQVKVVGQGRSMVAIKPIADRFYTLIDNASGTSASGYVGDCYREQDISYIENAPGGVVYSHLGGLYRIWAQAS